MQDRPTAIELLQAAQEFCEKDLLPALEGRVRFHARVLLNVLGILEREWANEPAAVRAEWQRLSDLLGKDEESGEDLSALSAQVRAYNIEFAKRIREGAFDDRLDEAGDVLRQTIAEKIEIANPRYVKGG